MIFTFYQIVMFFFIYSFIGWCLEVAYQGVTNGILVNRGFLNGPACPIYGVGMIGVLLALIPLQDNLLILFIGGIIIATVIELIGGWALDKMFHMRWWDYSDKPFNYKGYICLEFSLIWGMGAAAVVRLIHPIIESTVNKIPHKLGIVLLAIFSIAMISDIIVTYKTVIGITRSLGEVEKIAETLREISDNLTEKVGTTAIIATEKAEESKEKLTDSKDKLIDAIEIAKLENDRKRKVENELKRIELEERREEMELKYAKAMEKLQKQSKRMVNAFPKMHISDNKKLFSEYIKNLRK